MKEKIAYLKMYVPFEAELRNVTLEDIAALSRDPYSMFKPLGAEVPAKETP